MTAIYLNNVFRILAGKVFPSIRRSFTSERILETNYLPGTAFSFIQVGAADGKSHDFLFNFVKKRTARGLVIEPLHDLFEKLVCNYGYSNEIIPVNLAVHKNKTSVELFRVDEEQLGNAPSWASGIASVYPEHYKKSGIDKSLIRRVIVPSAQLMDIVKKHFKGTHIDLFQVDVEGYDYEVLKQFDFTTYKPFFIRFEYINLSAEDTGSAIEFLKKWGYHCFFDDLDIIAVNLKRVRI